MTKLSDTQSILLATAATRDNASLLPVSDTVTAKGTGLHKAVAALIKRGFAEERETTDSGAVLRGESDLRYGVFATSAGLAAIGVEDTTDPDPALASPPPSPTRPTKSAAIAALLQRVDGATLGELIAATGWLPHTTRAALTGLRKKGYKIERSKRGDDTCYRIVEAA